MDETEDMFERFSYKNVEIIHEWRKFSLTINLVRQWFFNMIFTRAEPFTGKQDEFQTVSINQQFRVHFKKNINLINFVYFFFF